MPASCCVPDCELKYAHSDDVSYHKFPLKKPTILAQWIQFTGRDPDWVPTKWSAICSRHFKPTDFKDCIYRKNLISTAVPSIRIKHQTPLSEFTSKLCATDDISHDFQSDLQETETDQEDLSGEESNLLEITCRLCGIVFSKWCQGLLNDFNQHATVILKCLPFLNMEDTHFPSKVCGHCLKLINGFSAFYDNVMKAQGDLEHKYNHNHQQDTAHVPVTKGLKIKQEPLVSIKEETVDCGVKNRDAQLELAEKTLIIKNPTITNDKNKILLFNNQNSEGQSSKLFRESKNCEILEIVNLYPPIVDITSATVREVQPYEIAFPSVSSSSFLPPAPQIINLKTEVSAEVEDEYEDYSSYFQDYQSGLNTLEEHSYSKLPIQADDNKDEIFSYLPQTSHSDAISLGDAGSIRVIHVELQPPVEQVDPVVVKHSCQQCHRKYLSRLKLIQHRVLSCHWRKRNLYRCVHCVAKCRTWAHLQTHLKRCLRKSFKLRRLTTRANEIKANRKNSHDKISSTPSDEANQQKQTTDLANAHRCSMCERSYSSLSNLRRHMNSHRPVDQWNHKCGICLKIFDKLFDLKKHFKLAKCAGGSEASEYVLLKPDDERFDVTQVESNHLLYVCTTCNKQFKSYNSLKVHESVHTGLKVFVCETCGKRFGGQMNLVQHRLTHVDSRQFACKLCPKVFKRSGGLSQHVKAFHMQIKPHQCPVCKRCFALKADMLRCRHSKLREFEFG
ncbi:telomere zinc finger-associated protein-like [Toxorhynchites rutilus septentrionalis]|uniref:telomere zinc finger-associated protein-like n=1 Tax=Toxorhynchites rutilus septentrionalis TaxID=329112 RepID=UPI0024798696|nr:telomere zinc finger-associated protein-like [Toxorhynchites rutilus septentrionalis]